MRCARACVRSDSYYCLTIELHREAGCQVVGDEDLVRSFRQVDWIVIRKAEQNRQNSDVHVDEIADSLSHERARVTRELLSPLEQHEIERFLSAEILLNQFFDLA